MAQAATGIGGRIAPPRFLAFIAAFLIGIAIALPLAGWRIGVMIAFDAAAFLFLLLVWPLLHGSTADVRRAARVNDANRALLLVVTGIVMVAVLVAVAVEVSQKQRPDMPVIGLIVATLALAWTFSNTVYALHYAHLFYDDAEDGRDTGGLAFPKTDEPDYWDFIYFAFCNGMTFQVSDVSIESGRLRRVVTAQCLAAFVFNLGVVAFTVNVLGSGG